MNPVYLRLERMGGKRDSLDYGSKFNISALEMETMLTDVGLVLEKVKNVLSFK